MAPLTWKTSSTFSMATPMNLADTSKTPTSSADLMSNMTFLNLQTKKKHTFHEKEHFSTWNTWRRTYCEGGSPSISKITPFSYSLCAVYLISPRYTSSFPFCCLARGFLFFIWTRVKINTGTVHWDHIHVQVLYNIILQWRTTK